MHNIHWRPSFFNAKFSVFLVLRFLSTFDMFFSRHNSTRKHHKTFSCHLFGVRVLLVHILTLLLLRLVMMAASTLAAGRERRCNAIIVTHDERDREGGDLGKVQSYA